MENTVLSAYDKWKREDIISILKPAFRNSGYVLRDDGKYCHPRISITDETPWHHIKPMPEFDCATWHQVIFNAVVPQLPEAERFVPSRCQQCWKIVVRPQNLKQLMALEAMQTQMGVPSKCGIEVRPAVYGHYGGYFYTDSLENGLSRYYEVCKSMRSFVGTSGEKTLLPVVEEVDENGHTTKVVLKRGCTEFEHALGDSSKWQITEAQVFIEKLVDRWLVKDDVIRIQPDNVLNKIHRSWVEWAFANGDPTYALYTNGKPLYPAYFTYHNIEGDIEISGVGYKINKNGDKNVKSGTKKDNGSSKGINSGIGKKVTGKNPKTRKKSAKRKSKGKD